MISEHYEVNKYLLEGKQEGNMSRRTVDQILTKICNIEQYNS
jgi:hypothetical protein